MSIYILYICLCLYIYITVYHAYIYIISMSTCLDFNALFGISQAHLVLDNGLRRQRHGDLDHLRPMTWKRMKNDETLWNMRSKPASYTTIDHDLELHACCVPLNLTPRLAGLLDRHRHWDLVVGLWARLWHRHVALLVNVLWHLAGRDNVKTGIWIHLGETIPLPQWFHGVPHLPHTTIVMRMTLPCEHMSIQETTWGWPGTGTLITFGGSLVERFWKLKGVCCWGTWSYYVDLYRSTSKSLWHQKEMCPSTTNASKCQKHDPKLLLLQSLRMFERPNPRTISKLTPATRLCSLPGKKTNWIVLPRHDERRGRGHSRRGW